MLIIHPRPAIPSSTIDRVRPALRSETLMAIQCSTIRRVRPALPSETLAQKSTANATEVERFSTAHRLPATPPSATTDPVVHMASAAIQRSMTHQLRPTLPSTTEEPVTSLPLQAVSQPSTAHRLLVMRSSPTRAALALTLTHQGHNHLRRFIDCRQRNPYR